MYKINENYQKLPGSYLFSTIARKVAAFTEASPDKEIIRLGIGDVTQPLAPAIIQAMHKAVDEMGDAAAFRGYAPDAGYDFLRNAIAEPMKFLFLTGLRVIQPIFRKFSAGKTELQSVTRCTRYMWIPM